MPHFQHLPLGTRIPDRLHAVSCSLPTMRDVIGYEEKETATVSRMTSGYPRFVVHPMLGAIDRAWRKRCGLAGHVLWITSSERMAQSLAQHLAPAVTRVLAHDGVHGLAHEDSLELRQKAKAFLQHTGGFLSSRAAEDYALRNGMAAATEDEAACEGDAGAAIRAQLARLFPPVDIADVLLAPSGMNAFWAAFQAVSDFQRHRGRDTWLQVGWLYLDTGAILAKFTGGRLVCVHDVADRGAIEAAFREHGPRLAGVVTEVTTNPLMRTADVPWLGEMARAHGAFALIDPSIVSPYNVDVVPHADIVLNSLTKYAACEGDVIAGAVVLTPRCPERAALRAAIADGIEPPYHRDLARLAGEMSAYDELLPVLNANARAVVVHLESRIGRGVRHVYWSLQEDSRANYLKLARGPERIGPVVSFEVEGELAPFYDALPMAKGPSFGMRTTLICPFVYLAHYDLVKTAEGRRTLAEARLPRDLLRLSVGAEPVDELIAALETGFAAAGRP